MNKKVKIMNFTEVICKCKAALRTLYKENLKNKKTSRSVAY